MLNFFITYECNFHCDYCFVRGFGSRYPTSVSADNFSRLCEWLQKKHVYSLGILGGEPTLHPRLVPMLQALNQAGVAPVLFTNALFPDSLRKPLAETVVNFVVNYNDPAMYTDRQHLLLEENIAALKAMDCNVSFSRNFSKSSMRYDYILDGCERHGIQHIRYDISRPNPVYANDYFNLEESRELTHMIVAFVRECEQRGIETGLDCCLPLCFFSAEERDYLRQISMKFSGICHPSLDIQSDLSVTYCIPLQDISAPDVTTFGSESALLGYFADTVRSLRTDPERTECRDCPLFGKSCQGGCLALKQKLLHREAAT